MNNITENELQKLTVPTVGMRSHQVQLKQALHAASRPDNKTIKKGWRDYMTKRNFLVTAGGMAFVMLAVLAYGTLGGRGQIANAQQLTKQSIGAFSKLTPSEQQALNDKIHGDALSDLEAAKKAKDLTVLSYDAFVKEYPNMQLRTNPGAGKPTADSAVTSLNPQLLKYLRYTDDKGATHILGIDSKGLPVTDMVFNHNQDGSDSGLIRVNTDGAAGGSTSAGAPAPPADMPSGSSCTRLADGGMMCSGSGSAPAGSEGTTCQTSSDGKVTCAQLNGNPETNN